MDQFLSWDKSLNILLCLQKRLFKASYVGDVYMLKRLQQLILDSSVARFLAIRQITQFSLDSRVPGIDGKILLTFVERFELNEFLKNNYKNWFPQSIKKVSLLDKDNNKSITYISTISDRVWQLLIKFSLDPIHEAFFHPNNLGFRLSSPLYRTQKILLLNSCSESFLVQKRLMSIDLTGVFIYFDENFLLSKLKIFKSVKLGIFRLIRKGFRLGYFNNYLINISVLLLNILLDGIEDLGFIIRNGFQLLLFLLPMQNEKFLSKKIFHFISKIGADATAVKIVFFSGAQGFSFLEWDFKFISKKANFISIPSKKNYSLFLKRIKHIINNSNYGVNIKVQKLFPVIREWKEYHKFSKINNLAFFSVKKRALKVFSKESKQDFYSSKRLVDKCFFLINSFGSASFDLHSKILTPYFGHLIFCIDYFKFLCIHCGVDLVSEN